MVRAPWKTVEPPSHRSHWPMRSRSPEHSNNKGVGNVGIRLKCVCVNRVQQHLTFIPWHRLHRFNWFQSNRKVLKGIANYLSGEHTQTSHSYGRTELIRHSGHFQNVIQIYLTVLSSWFHKESKRNSKY